MNDFECSYPIIGGALNLLAALVRLGTTILERRRAHRDQKDSREREQP
jgi:hypothetical protein